MLFAVILFGLSARVDPLVVARAISGEKIHRLMVVSRKEMDFHLFDVPVNKGEGFLVYSVKQMEPEVEKCLGELPPRSISLCFLRHFEKKRMEHEILYVRVPRKLRPLGSIQEMFPLSPQLIQKLLNSDEEVGASSARAMYNLSGKRVVVGIVDTGVRWNSKWLSHRMLDDISPLLDEDERNSSKAVLLWDQRPYRNSSFEFPKDATYPAGFTYGFECREPSRRAKVLPGYNSCESDYLASGHGTHVAGIVSMELGDFTGVSPDSLLFVVSTNLYEDEVVDAVRYVFAEAQRIGLPAVVNISLGGHFGPHDGTSLFERLLVQELGKGRVIVAAAGNEGRENIHIGGRFSGTLSAIAEVRDDCEIQLWFPQGSDVEITVDFNGRRATVRKGDREIMIASERKVALIDFTSSADVPFAELLQYSLSDRKDSAVFISTELTGQLKFTFRFSSETEFDAWVSSEPSDCFFSDKGDIKPNYEKTIAVPATARDIIAVGYYIVEGEDRGKISPNSSIGSDDISKPNICAPGHPIYSLCPDSDDNLCVGTGSSQATPHVSGAVALALERNPQLSPQDILQILCASARRDEHTGEVPNKIWGCGKLRIPEMISLVKQHVPEVQSYPVLHWVGRESIIYAEDGRSSRAFYTLVVTSEYPFRIVGPRVLDLGWTRKHKLYLITLPERLDVEFANGVIKRVYLTGEGLKVESCGCFVSARDGAVSASILILLVLVVFCIIRRRASIC